MNNEALRLSRVEAVCAQARDEMPDVLERAYQAACDRRDADTAAELARKIRDRLLAATDAQMSIDRVGLDTNSAAKFILSLSALFHGAWAVYRQQLRDLPEQEGFPFQISWPVSPDMGGADG